MSTSPLNHHLYVAIPQHYRYFAQGILATSPFAQQRNWPLKSLPIGMKRAVGTPRNQKLPITAEMLLQIHTTLR